MSELSVTLDGRLWASPGGIGRYVRELVAHAPDVRWTLAGAEPADGVAPPGRLVPFAAKLYSPAEQLFGGRVFRRAGGDVFHFPHYTVPLCQPPRPFVVTVHDLIHFKFPELFGRMRVRLARTVLAVAARRADRIICVSHATRADLLAMLPAVADKTVVVHQGVSSRFRPAGADEVERVRQQFALSRYVLCMGDRKPYKRFQVALAAADRLRRADPGLQLVVVGEVGSAIRSSPPPGVVLLGNVGDDVLPALYSGAECLLFPSAYEGFGLPIIEAGACGCPVVCGTGSSLDEVAGGSAEQVDAADPAAVAQAAERLITDRDYRAGRAAAALTNAARFTWQRTADQTVAVYREIKAGYRSIHPLSKSAEQQVARGADRNSNV